jgi:hypothetical protein
MRKVWKEIQSGREWIVDADLKDFFGSVVVNFHNFFMLFL